jgi:hypothetical protein
VGTIPVAGRHDLTDEQWAALQPLLPAGKRPGPPPRGGIGPAEPDDHALGRSRGGFTTKLHLGCEQGRKPMSLLITAGQRGDSPQFQAVVDGIRVPSGARDDRGHDRTGSWPTRHTARKATGTIYVGAGSRRRSPSMPTRPRIVVRRARPVGDHRRSTRMSTGSGTLSSAASTSSNNTVR